MTMIWSVEFTQEEAVEIHRYAVNNNYEDAVDLIRQVTLYHVSGKWRGVDETIQPAPESEP